MRSGSPSPSRYSSSARYRSTWLSALLPTRMTGRPPRRSACAISSSSAVTPSRTSTMKQQTSASVIAICACSRVARVSAAISGAAFFGNGTSSPAVSTIVKRFPPHSTTPYRRSRVRPANASTIARRVPVRRLNSVDFPTFGRPTIATTPTAGAIGSPSSRRRRRVAPAGLICPRRGRARCPSRPARTGRPLLRARMRSCPLRPRWSSGR